MHSACLGPSPSPCLFLRRARQSAVASTRWRAYRKQVAKLTALWPRPPLRRQKPPRQAAQADDPDVVVLEPPPASNCYMVVVSVLLIHNYANTRIEQGPRCGSTTAYCCSSSAATTQSCLLLLWYSMVRRSGCSKGQDARVLQQYEQAVGDVPAPDPTAAPPKTVNACAQAGSALLVHRCIGAHRRRERHLNATRNVVHPCPTATNVNPCGHAMSPPPNPPPYFRLHAQVDYTTG